MIEPRLLRFFIAVADELSFSKAAKRLHISQSPLSYAIKQLEQQIGTSLFERTTRQVALTPAGRVLYEEAQKLLLRHASLQARIQRVSEGYEGEINIGFVGSMLFRGLANLLTELKKQNPNVEYKLQEMNSSTQIHAIERGDIDLGFIHETAAPITLSAVNIWHEPFLLCVPEKRYKNIDSLELASLKKEPFIFFSQTASPTYYELLVLQCAEAGFYPQVSYQAPHWLSVISMVAQDLGVSIVPSTLQQSGIHGVLFYPIKKSHTSISQLVYKASHASGLIQSQFQQITAFYQQYQSDCL